MTGVSLRYRFDTGEIVRRLELLPRADKRQLFTDIGERVIFWTLLNFDREQTPDGDKWEPSQRAIEENGKTLQDRGHLRDSYTYLVSLVDDAVEIGSNMVYAAIHHFGGTIKKKARSGSVYFKQNTRTGEIGNRFVKKSKSNFAQDVQIGAHDILMPARPALGITRSQHEEIGEMVIDFYAKIIGSNA